MELYSRHQGGLRINLPAEAYQGGDLDIVATLHKDAETHRKYTALLTVAHLNAEGWFEYHARFTLEGCRAGGSVKMITLKAQGFTPSALFDVVHSTSTVGKGGLLSLTVPPFSVVHSVIVC